MSVIFNRRTRCDASSFLLDREKYLVGAGADVTLKNDDKKTVLTIAEDNGYLEIETYLQSLL